MEFGATCGSPLLNHSLQHGYLVKPVTIECKSDIGVNPQLEIWFCTCAAMKASH
jgi:hypothetical protein